MEIWKDVVGYERLYQVSDKGNVYSFKTYRLLTLNKTNLYTRVGLTKNGKTILKKVHRLVTKAFIENTNNFPCVNHLNKNKHDNRVENLEWITHHANALHSVGHKDYKERDKSNNIFAKARYNKERMTQEQLADKMNVTRQTVIRWEQGANKPDIHDIIKLAKVLDLSYDELLNHYNKERVK